jgi:hypothetical protein
MSFISSQLSPVVIEDLIKYHNEDLPKNPNANPNDLILAENEISKAIKDHLGNLVAIVGYGEYGSGKTWTCYKIFHDLKLRDVYLTYVPLRIYREKRGQYKQTLNSRGVASLIATAIAEALITPRTLNNNVSEVLTNAFDKSGFNINRGLEEVLRDYNALLKNMRKYHVVLLDEFDNGVESIDDIEALVDAIYTFRDIFDKDGSTRISLVALMAPIPAARLGPEYVNIPVYNIFEDRFINRATIVPGPFRAKILLGVNLNKEYNVMSMLKNFVARSIDIVRQKFNININIENIDEAVRLLAKIWPTMRWSKDILIKALAEAITAASVTQQVNLLKYVHQALMISLDLNSPGDIEKIFIDGKWSYIGRYSTAKLQEFSEKILKDVCGHECTAECYDKREEPGFLSIFCRVNRMISRRGGGREILSKNIVIWLRLSDIVKDETIAKARNIFGDNYIILMAPDHVKIRFVPNNTLKVIKLSSPLLYYLLTAGEKNIDPMLRRDYEKVLDEEIRKHTPSLTISLGELFV